MNRRWSSSTSKKRQILMRYKLASLMALLACLSGCGGSSGGLGATGSNGPAGPTGPASRHVVKANGTVIGEWIGGYIQLSSNYFFSLYPPTDGISITAQVAPQPLYYTTSDCSGTSYTGNAVYSGNIFVGYGAVNTPSLFYISSKASLSQLPIFSQREYFQSTSASISFGGTPASGVYTLNFNGSATANINWNDSAAQIQTKIIADISTIIAASVIQATTYISISYQTAIQNSNLDFTVTGNTLKTSGAVALPATVTMYKTVPGTCVIKNGLNAAVAPALPNDSSVTGLSTMSFPLPITIE